MIKIEITETDIWFESIIDSKRFDISASINVNKDPSQEFFKLYEKLANRISEKYKQRWIAELQMEKNMIHGLQSLTKKNKLYSISAKLLTEDINSDYQRIISILDLDTERKFFNADLSLLICNYNQFFKSLYTNILYHLEVEHMYLEYIANKQNATLQEKLYEIENILKTWNTTLITYLNSNKRNDREVIIDNLKITNPEEMTKRNSYNQPNIKDAKYGSKNLFEKIFWINNERILQIRSEFKKDIVNRAINEVRSDLHNEYINNYNYYMRTVDEINITPDRVHNTIERSINIFISSLNYPTLFTKEFATSYNEENKMLVIDFQLPALEEYPKEKEIRFMKTKYEIKRFSFTESQNNKIFENAVFSSSLMVLQSVHKWDLENNIEMITFNWWINEINRATWIRENICVVSIQATKEEILKINLELVDPKECFKSLKWIWGIRSSSMTPIQPIIRIDRDDSRFVANQNIMNHIDEWTNLASMNREDFEHLIREIFEKEFSVNGWEVKVTQWSKDWWVDAIAFDPDPIRWWKIVIQAKRYTNTVWVSAVRDLYWTVMNEWATKWILVTTSDFWPDAFKFCKWKPITLMSWANLLHLLEKHWKNAFIDIKLARSELWL